MTDGEKILEGQLRECYGRVVYTHKAHEKCADLLLNKHKRIKFLQLALSALVTGGIFGTLSEAWKLVATTTSAVLSTILLALNSYTKDYDLGQIAQKHRQTGAELWSIREKYLSLLSDIRVGDATIDEYRARRDKLSEELHAIYTGAPSTDSKAYQHAQAALQLKEDLTFSVEEIDAFLPKELKRAQ
jgi:SMODS and SLOG-associating 2TM effector domain family 4